MATYDRKFVLDTVRKQHPEFAGVEDSTLSQALSQELGGSEESVLQALGEEFERSGIKPPKPTPAKATLHDILGAVPLVSGATLGPLGKLGAEQLIGTGEQIVGDAKAVSRLPKTLGPALTGKATPEEYQEAAHGVAALGGLAGGIAGGMLGGPPGKALGGLAGEAIGAGLGGGLLGGSFYSAMKSPGDQPVQTGFDALLAAAFGAGAGVVMGSTAPHAQQARATQRALETAATGEPPAPRVAPEPLEPSPRELPRVQSPFGGVGAIEPPVPRSLQGAQGVTFRESEVPGLQPTSLQPRPGEVRGMQVPEGMEFRERPTRPLGKPVPPYEPPPPPAVGTDVPPDLKAGDFWSRVSNDIPDLDLNKTVGQARAVPELPPVMEEAAKRSKFTTEEQVKLQSQDIVREAIRSIRKTEWFSGRRAQLLKKQFSESERADMTFYREKTGNPYVPNDTPEAVAGRLSPEAKAAVEQVGQILEHTREIVNESGYGKDVGFVENYISHLWVGKLKHIQGVARNWVRANPFAKKRTFESFEAGMRKAGLTPRTLDIAELLQYYENISGRMIATNRMIEALKVTPAPDGAPLLTSIKEAPAGYKMISHPALGGPLAVHPDAYPMVNFALQQPMSGAFPSFMGAANAYAKKAALSFSLFHHLTLTEQAAGALGFSKPKYFLPPMVIEASARGLKMLNDPALASELIDAGVTLSAPGDAQVGVVRRGLQALEAKTRTTPGLGQLTHAVRSINDIWDDVLWNRYFNGLKAMTYYELKDHYMQIRPDVPEAQIRAELGEAINNIYGGQTWDNLFGRFIVDPQVQQAMHWAMLAPDWTLSNVAAATQAVSKRPIIGAVGRRALMGHMLYVFASTQLLNYVFTSLKGQPHWTWDNDPGHKMDVELPWHNDKGRKEYMSIGKSIKEVLRWFTEPLEQLGAKVAPFPQFVTEQLTGYTTTGFPTSFNPERMEAEGVDPNLINQLQARVLDTVEKVIPFAFRGNNAFMAFPLSQGMTPYKTMKMYEAALRDSDYARIAVISQHASENGIPVGRIFDLAYRNVAKTTRKQLKARAEFNALLQKEQGREPASR